MNKENIGDMIVELKEIEELNQFNKDNIDLFKITYGSGGFLTLICCTP